MKKFLKKIFNFSTYIRVVFSSLMVLPIIILICFIVYFSKTSDCLSLYLKNAPRVSTPITWPHQGLVTLWFDNHFFTQNSEILIPLMNKYQFPGMVSLLNEKRCPISMSKLIALNYKGWEITKTNPKMINGQHEINDLPAADARMEVFFDMSKAQNEALLSNYLQKTKTSNGWLIIYFHIANSHEKSSISSAQLNHILQMIQRSNIPVVLQSQVLRISQ